MPPSGRNPGPGHQLRVQCLPVLARHSPGTQAAVTAVIRARVWMRLSVSCSHLELTFYLLEVTARVASTSPEMRSLGPFSGTQNSRTLEGSPARGLGLGPTGAEGEAARARGTDARRVGPHSSLLLGQIHRPHSLPAYLGHVTPFSPASKRHCLRLSLGHVLLEGWKPGLLLCPLCPSLSKDTYLSLPPGATVPTLSCALRGGELAPSDAEGTKPSSRHPQSAPRALEPFLPSVPHKNSGRKLGTCHCPHWPRETL